MIYGISRRILIFSYIAADGQKQRSQLSGVEGERDSGHLLCQRGRQNGQPLSREPHARRHLSGTAGEGDAGGSEAGVEADCFSPNLKIPHTAGQRGWGAGGRGERRSHVGQLR